MSAISATGRGFCYGRVQELADGRLMVPFYGTPADRRDEAQRLSAVVFSRDGGQSWPEYTMLCADQADAIRPSETDLLPLSDGRYLAIMRANARNRLYRSYSADEGQTWTEPESTDMPGQSPALLRLESGAILCAYRDRTEGAPGLSCGG